MADRDAEATLVAFLKLQSEADDPVVADRAVDLYLTRFGEDQGARLAALKRLTGALLSVLGDEDRGDEHQYDNETSDRKAMSEQGSAG